jgi:DNA polymerase (family X)
MRNKQIASLFDEMADLLELKEENPFRVRSYRQAALTIRNLSGQLSDRVEQGEALTDLEHIGRSMAEKIEELLESGHCRQLDELREQMPEGLDELMQVPSLGPQRVIQLNDEAGISTLDELEKACRNGDLRRLDGFGATMEKKILNGIATVRRTKGRVRLDEATEVLEGIGRQLDTLDGLSEWVAAGSLRRRCETIGDIDLLIQTEDRAAVMEQLSRLEEVSDLIEQGEEKMSVRLDDGLRVDFRFFEADSFGAALLYFTGSKQHNIALRKRARSKGWKLNEYGLMKGARRLAGKSEAEVYQKLGMDWIPPELREDHGEIDAALKGSLPHLVEVADIRGDLHAHTHASDGALSIRELADAAREKGYSYLAITDHSKRVTMANGLDDARLRKHAAAIRITDAALDRFWLLAGVECDILRDGSLDLEEKTLADLDWVIGSVHYEQQLSRKESTDRLLRAVESGLIHCLGHPTGRMIGSRDEMSVDWERLFAACAEHQVCVEINAQPDRLDLPDRLVRLAAEKGVTFVISTDSHSRDDLDLISYGVDIARRGGLEKQQLLNTCSLTELRRRLS